MHRHRPAAEPDHWSPCAEHYVSANDCTKLPRSVTLNGTEYKTPPNVWRAAVVIAELSRDGRPAYGGVRGMAYRAGMSPTTFIKHTRTLEAIGAVEIDRRPGIGRYHYTNLYRPKRSPFWGCFYSCTDSNSVANALNLEEIYKLPVSLPCNLKTTGPAENQTDKPVSLKETAPITLTPETRPDPVEVEAFRGGAASRCRALLSAEIALWVVWTLNVLGWNKLHFLQWVAANHRPARYRSQHAAWKDLIRQYRPFAATQSHAVARPVSHPPPQWPPSRLSDEELDAAAAEQDRAVRHEW